MSAPLSNLKSKILCIQSWGIGDLVMTLPLLAELRRKYINDQISVAVGGGGAKELLQSAALADEIFLLKTRPLRSALESLQVLASKRFGGIFLATEISAGLGLLAKGLTGSRHLVGATNGLLSNLFNQNISFDPYEHRVVTNLRLADVSKGVSDIHLPRISISEEAKKFAGTFLQRHVGDSKRIVVLHPGGGEFQRWKRPSWGQFSSIARDLLSSFEDLHVLIILGPEDGDVMSECVSFQDGVGSRVTIFESNNLINTLAILSKASLVIAGDTGIGHMTALVQTPSITLAGPTCYWRTCPWNTQGYTIVKDFVAQNVGLSLAEIGRSLGNMGLDTLDLSLASNTAADVLTSSS